MAASRHSSAIASQSPERGDAQVGALPQAALVALPRAKTIEDFVALLPRRRELGPA